MLSGTTVLAETRYTYDSQGKGNLVTLSKWVSGTQWLPTTVVPNTNGTVASVTEANGAQTSLSYGACNGQLPTSATTSGPGLPTGGLATGMGWDCSGGVQISLTDENLNVVKTDFTSNGADPFYRPKGTIDQLLNETYYTYQPNAQYQSPSGVESSLTFNNGTSVVDHRTYLDSLGRPLDDQILRAPGSSTLDTVSYSYDANGRLYSKSLPCTGSATATCPVTPATTQTYDALTGRLSPRMAAGGLPQTRTRVVTYCPPLPRLVAAGSMSIMVSVG